MKLKPMTLEQLLKKKRKPQIRFTEDEKQYIRIVMSSADSGYFPEEEAAQEIKLLGSIDSKLKKGGW